MYSNWAPVRWPRPVDQNDQAVLIAVGGLRGHVPLGRLKPVSIGRYGHRGGFPNVLVAARAGEEWAWERLFGSVARPLRAYAHAHGAADPDDVCGEVLLRVVRDLPGFAGDEAGFRSWTFTIAHHRLVDERRRHGRAKSQRSFVAAFEPGADERALENLEVAGWRHRLARLSADQRNVLLLRIVAGLDTDEVARVLGKRPGHVRVLLHRACGALRDNIDRVTR